MPFSMRQQKLDKLCQTCKIDRSRLTKYCRGMSPASPVLWGVIRGHAVAPQSILSSKSTLFARGQQQRCGLCLPVYCSDLLRTR